MIFVLVYVTGFVITASFRRWMGFREPLVGAVNWPFYIVIALVVLVGAVFSLLMMSLEYVYDEIIRFLR